MKNSILVCLLISLCGTVQAVDFSRLQGVSSAASVSSGSIVVSTGNSSASSFQSIKNVNGQVIQNTNISSGTGIGSGALGYTGANGQLFNISSYPLQIK